MLAIKTIPRANGSRRLVPEAQAIIRTDFGRFTMKAYRDDLQQEHLAVFKGDIAADNVLCRVHSECLTGEVFGSRRCECGPQLRAALESIDQAGRGIVVYLRQEGRGIGLSNKLRAYTLQDEGVDTHDANLALGFPADRRTYEMAAHILGDLGVRSVALMTNNPDKVTQLEQAGIPVSERLSHWVGIHTDNVGYVTAKRSRMGHLADS